MEAFQDIAEPPKIRVVVRKRPLTTNEGQSRDIVDVEGVGHLTVKEIKYVNFYIIKKYMISLLTPLCEC